MKELNQFELEQVAGGNDTVENLGWALGRGARWLWNNGLIPSPLSGVIKI